SLCRSTIDSRRYVAAMQFLNDVTTYEDNAFGGANRMRLIRMSSRKLVTIVTLSPSATWSRRA
ncbi:MAG: hypothetical protein ABI205_03900, partial [Gemmatimonadaceae bacterium]